MAFLKPFVYISPAETQLLFPRREGWVSNSLESSRSSVCNSALLCCSPDGKLLASVGGEPDFMLTLWDWKQELTVLRSKAFSQDVYRVSFSTELEGQLTSAGTGHIRYAVTSFIHHLILKKTVTDFIW